MPTCSPSAALPALVVALAIMTADVGDAAEDLAPPRSLGLQTLVPPEAHLDLGEVFFLEPGTDTQLAVLSYGPLRADVLTTRRMVGYIVAPFVGENDEKPILAGAFRLPAASLTTGSHASDRLWRSAALLDVDNHPEIEFIIHGVHNVERDVERPRDFRLTILAEAGLRGARRRFELPATLRYAPFTWQQMSRNVGDLWLLRFELRATPGELGFQPPPPVARLLANEIELRGALTFSNVSPEKSFDPRINQTDYQQLTAFIAELRDLDDRRAAYARGRRLLDDWSDRPDMLIRLADAVLEEGGVRRDPAFVRQALDRAATGDAESATLLAVRGRLAHELGEHAQALELTEMALAASGDDAAMSAALRARIEEYRTAKGE